MGEPHVGDRMRLEVVTGEPDLLAQAPAVQGVYEAVFTEPPYEEGPDDFQDFAEMWPDRVQQDGFRLVLAYDDTGVPIGMAFGRPLPESTGWWSGLLQDAPADVTDEWPGRSFGINEIAVLPGFRRRGLGRALHDRLLAGAPVERALLLSRPEAEPAQAAYKRWGYERVGPIRPYDGAPVYDAMVLPLRTD